MNYSNRVNALSLVAFATILIIFISFIFGGDIGLPSIVGIIASVIEIVLFRDELFKKEINLETVPKNVQDIKEYVYIERERDKIKIKFISSLVNEGIVNEKELFKMIRKNEIFIAYTYGESVVKTVKKAAGLKHNPLFGIFLDLGFVRATTLHNLLVIFSDKLPIKYRNIDALNELVRKELETKYEFISEKTKEHFPPSTHPILYQGWRDGSKFQVSYIISKSLIEDFIFDYININRFMPDFNNQIIRTIKTIELISVIKDRQYKIKDFISRISLEYLLDDIRPVHRDLIIQNEDAIKNELSISSITDYSKYNVSELCGCLNNHNISTNEEDIIKYSELIISRSQKIKEYLNEMKVYI